MASRRKGSDEIGAAIDGANVVPLQPRGGKSPAPAQDPDDGGAPEQPVQPSRNALPPGCPVTPLGTASGLYFYLDELRQVRELKPKEHEKKNLEALFGRRSDLTTEYWPRFGKPRINQVTGEQEFPVTGWQSEEAGRLFMAACADRGIWSAQGRVRGAGAHRGELGELILHCGDQVWIDGRYQPPGLIGDLVFPAGDKTPRFAVHPAGKNVGEDLLAMLETWRWTRAGGDGMVGLDAMMLLGWIAGATVCGALGWRPSIWITGGRGTGKSSLHKLLKLLLGHNGLIEAAMVTEAWVRQTLKMRTLPVALDELEAEADSRRTEAIIALARLAASGGRMGRGGADHTAHDFEMRSAFLFSSVLIPPMTPADRSRLAILELQPFEREDEAPKLEAAAIAEMGRAIRRRMLDQWERLDRVIEMFRFWLATVGHDARMQDQFGTLLGCAAVLIYDEIPEELAAAWSSRLDAKFLAEKADDEAEEVLVVRHIAQSPMPAVGGAVPETVSMWIGKVIAGDDDNAKAAQKRLEMIGLSVGSSIITGLDKHGGAKRKWHRHDGGEPMADRPLYVAVANSHRGLDLLLRDTRWKSGVWAQALKRGRGAIARHQVWMGGRNERATLVPLAAFVSGENEGDEA